MLVVIVIGSLYSVWSWEGKFEEMASFSPAVKATWDFH